MKSTLNIHWKDWYWSSNTSATWCEEPANWKRPWIWERLRPEGERGDRGWDGWMASSTQWAHEFEQTLGDSEGQVTLECCSSWGHKESDMTEQLNNNIFTHFLTKDFYFFIITFWVVFFIAMSYLCKCHSVYIYIYLNFCNVMLVSAIQ